MAPRRPQYRRTFIKQWREYRNLTQEQLAARIGISESHLSLLENGRRQYTQAFLEKTAEALATEPASLLMRNPLLDDPIWSIWDGLDPVQKRQAAAIIEGLKKVAT